MTRLLISLLISIGSYAQQVGSIPPAAGGSGSGTITNIATGCGLSGGPITTTGTLIAAEVAKADATTGYTFVAGDCGKLVTLSNAASITLTVPAAGGSFPDGWYVDVLVIGTGAATCSGATCTLTTLQSARFVSNGSTWRVLTGASSGSYSTVYCRSTTGNDTYVCAPVPAITAYVRGMLFNLDPDTANTGTATVAINGLSAISILNRAGSALADADITANRGTLIYYNGTSFNIIGDGGSGSTITGCGFGETLNGTVCDVNTAVIPSNALIQSSTARICRSTTGNDTYTCTLSPTLTSYGNGTTGSFCVILNADTASSGASSLNVDTLGAKAIQNADGTNATVLAGKPITACYDGTQFVAQGAGGSISNTVANGLTGATTFTNHGVLLGQTTSAIAATSAGTAGQVLTSNGASADPTFQAVSGGTTTFEQFLPFGGCNGSMAFLWNPGSTFVSGGYCALPALGAVELVAHSSNYAYMSIRIPTAWNGSTAPNMKITVFDGSLSATTTVILRAAISCTIDVGTQTYPTSTDSSTVTLSGTNYIPFTATFTGLTMSSCTAGQFATLRLGRNTSGGGTYSGANIVVAAPSLIWTVN